jgi:hypothetical protein
LLVALLLPFAVQFIHSFEKHEHSVCNAQNIIHFDSHEIDCSVFHFKINTNTIDFENKITFTENDFKFQKIHSQIEEFKAVTLYFKSSRAPPFLLI